MNVFGLNHINITAPVELMEKTREFYVNLMGLKVGDRPAVSRKGYWLYSGAYPIVHLAEPLPGHRLETGDHSFHGYMDHIAFSCKGVAESLEQLKRMNVPYRLSVIPGLGQVQVIIKDPAGTTVELNFQGESVPEEHRSRQANPA